MRSLWVLALSLALASNALGAIEVTLNSATVHAHSSGPGLLINTSVSGSVPQTLSFSGIGTTQSVELFNIWTNETSVNLGEDTVAQPISVDLFFSSTVGDFTGSATGETAGHAGFVLLFIPYGVGSVAWDGAFDIAFGANNDGLLRVELTDALFNPSLGHGNLTPGEWLGATIHANLTLISEPSAGAEPGDPGVHAPEAASLFVWAGLGLVGAIASRRALRAS